MVIGGACTGRIYELADSIRVWSVADGQAQPCLSHANTHTKGNELQQTVFCDARASGVSLDAGFTRCKESYSNSQRVFLDDRCDSSVSSFQNR